MGCKAENNLVNAASNRFAGVVAAGVAAAAVDVAAAVVEAALPVAAVAVAGVVVPVVAEAGVPRVCASCSSFCARLP